MRTKGKVLLVTFALLIAAFALLYEAPELQAQTELCYWHDCVVAGDNCLCCIPVWGAISCPDFCNEIRDCTPEA